MALSKNNVKIEVSEEDGANCKSTVNLVVRVNQDSDDNLQALFDSVLNPGDSKRPLQVPFRMRKLPNSFFNPPATCSRTCHSRASSADSAYDNGSQTNVNQSSTSTPLSISDTSGTSKNIVRPDIDTNRLTICHSRAHSSPASLQQTYIINNAVNADESCVQNEVGSSFDANLGSFTRVISATTKIERINQCTGQVTEANMQPFHVKQRSYDVISPIQLQNELGPLPPGWEQAKTNEGQIYYLNHNTKTTQWEDPRVQYKQQQNLQQSGHPREIIKESVSASDIGPLPEGWEQAYTESGDVYFINHINRTTSWDDPRFAQFLQKTGKICKTDINWGVGRQIHKIQEVFKQKSEQNYAQRSNTSVQIDPFLSGDTHARQESGDSGLSLSSNTFPVNTEYVSQIDDSMDGVAVTGNTLNGLDCADSLVSSLQLEDNICTEMFNDVQSMLTSPTKADNLEWYKIN